MRSTAPTHARPKYAPAFARAADQSPPPVVTPEAVEVAEAARLMSVSVSTAKRLVDSGELPSLAIGRLRRVRIAAIREFLERLEREASSAPGETPADTPPA